jgi:hypothetical protein
MDPAFEEGGLADSFDPVPASETRRYVQLLVVSDSIRGAVVRQGMSVDEMSRKPRRIEQDSALNEIMHRQAAPCAQ